MSLCGTFHLWLLKTETTWASSLLSLRGSDGPFTLCYLTFTIPVATWGPCVDWTKSSVTTLSLPSLRMQRCTARRTFCSLRSSAKRWGSVRIGRKASFSRDSLITSLNLYAGRDNSCSRNSVELFILRNNHRTSFSSWNLPKSLHQPKRHSHAALGQWWQDGDLILRVLPKPGRKNMMKMEENQQSRIFQHEKKLGFLPQWGVVSPSGIIQVQRESFLTEFGKDFIMMSVHVTCESRKVHKDDSDCESGNAHLKMTVRGYHLLMRKSKIDMSMMLSSLFPELYGYICFTVSQKKGFTSHLQPKWKVLAALIVQMCGYYYYF